MAAGSTTAMGCFCLFPPKGPSSSSSSGRSGYRMLNYDDDRQFEDEGTVTVVVGKERRAFAVSPILLRSDPFEMLMNAIGKKVFHGEDLILAEDVDSILFEHLLWLGNNNECPSILRCNLKEILEFYAHDS